ncbi:phosphatase PAP2 family protein [uncultured Desulfobacter sp.]|uniref:phosphatase PAP2 family protein n=1 Tax=uncultured Desulfobacter sp. TaxID=240139 RepID=UPI002AABFA17|nr:phosphatase PAP2 family protein [uncultured Desulfobacter sp.]
MDVRALPCSTNRPEQESCRSIQPSVGFVCLVVSAAIVMLAIVPVDYRLTAWLHKWQWPVLSKIMEQSIFEGEIIGGSDFSVILLILVFAGYVHCVLFGDRSPISRFRPHMGFILIASFWTCLCDVYGLKWIMGRARPGLVMNHGESFSNGYEWGPHFITHGSYNGSFPSGHTTLAFIFMSLAYVLAGIAAIGGIFALQVFVLVFLPFSMHTGDVLGADHESEPLGQRLSGQHLFFLDHHSHPLSPGLPPAPKGL